MSKQKSMGKVLQDAMIKWVRQWHEELKNEKDCADRMYQFMADAVIAEHERRKRAKVKTYKVPLCHIDKSGEFVVGGKRAKRRGKK